MGRKDNVVPLNNNWPGAIGARMRHARQQKKISLTDMARFLTYTKSYLSAVENGASKPSALLLEGYERLLELEPGYLTRPQHIFSPRQLSPLMGTASTEGNGNLEDVGFSAGPDIDFPSRMEWGNAPHIAAFYGREHDSLVLEKYLITDSCKVVVVYGLGGMGKTALSLKVARQIQEQFDFVFWRSLRDAPKLEDILKDSIALVSQQKQQSLPEHLDEQLEMFIECLRKHRYLLMLDNFDTVLQAGKPTGQYREGYDGYGKLIELVGEEDHQGCLLITSREKPRQVARVEGSRSPVRSIELQGIKVPEVRELLQDKGLEGNDEVWAKLTHKYSGNPLVLKLISATIREVFDGNIAEFLDKGAVVGDMYDMLNRQFETLSEQEQEILYWLAIERESVSLEDLQEDILGLDRQELFVLLDSLRRRSLIEAAGAGRFSLQPVVMEFVTERFVKQIAGEIESDDFKFFERCALIKAQSKNYIREAQVRLILQPVVAGLRGKLGREGAEEKLRDILASAQKRLRHIPGYLAGNVLNLLIGADCNLRGYDFSHLFVWQAYLQDVSLPQVNFAYANLEKSVFTDTFGSILTVAISPDGRLLAAGTANGEIRLWNAQGKLLQTFEGHTNRVRTVNFSPDGRLLVSGSEDQTIRIWAIEGSECIRTLVGHTNRVRAAGFSYDNSRIVSGGDDQTVRLWDVKTGRSVNVLSGHTNRVNAVGFSPDGKLIASGSEDQTVAIWDARSGKHLKDLKGDAHQIYSLSFSPDSSSIVSGSEDQLVQIWDIKTGQSIKTFSGHRKRVRAVGFSPDGQTIVSGSDDQTVRQWDVESGQLLKTFRGHTHRVRAVAFGIDGKTLVSGSDDQTVRLWDAESGQCLKMLQGHANRIYSVAFSPDGETIVSGSDDRLVRMWNIRERRCFKTLQGHGGRVYSAAFSPDGKTIVSGSDDQTVCIWNAETGLRLQTLQEHDNWVRSVAFSPDGTTVASGSQDQTIRLWDARTGLSLRTLEGHTNWVRSIGFSLDGKFLISGSEDRTVRLWDSDTGECLRVLQDHEKGVRAATFSADGGTVASGSDDHKVRLWNAKTGALLRPLCGHIGWILSVCFSPDQTTLVSGSEDQTIRLWNVETGQCRKILQGHTSGVYSVVFSPSGEKLASASHDGMIKLWDVESGNCLDTLTNDRPYEKMDITDVSGLTIAQESMLKDLGAIEH